MTLCLGLFHHSHIYYSRHCTIGVIELIVGTLPAETAQKETLHTSVTSQLSSHVLSTSRAFHSHISAFLQTSRMSSSSAANNVLSAGILPTTNTLIPAGIALAVFAPVACLLNIPPLIFHFRNRNTAAVSLVAWVLFHNLLSLINLLIWPTDDFKDRYNGEGLCDVEIKFIVARAVALPAATLCIVRSLANVMNTNKSISIPTAAQRRRAMVMDLVWCVGLPIIMMFLHYIVQPNRYFLAGVSGCTPSFWSGWVSILLTCLPPLLLSLANAFYAGMLGSWCSC